MNACVIKYLGDKKLCEITSLMCQQTINKQKGKSKCQINATYQLLNFIFERAVDAVDKLNYAPYFMLIYGCGCRPSEAANVEGRDIVEFKGRKFIHIRGTKSRNAPVPPYPLASDITTYSLRHTYCTNLKAKGVDIRTAQYLMGHSDIKNTANIYTHIGAEQLV